MVEKASTFPALQSLQPPAKLIDCMEEPRKISVELSSQMTNTNLFYKLVRHCDSFKSDYLRQYVPEMFSFSCSYY